MMSSAFEGLYDRVAVRGATLCCAVPVTAGRRCACVLLRSCASIESCKRLTARGCWSCPTAGKRCVARHEQRMRGGNYSSLWVGGKGGGPDAVGSRCIEFAGTVRNSEQCA
jgi:hypothetical protein